jgi:hypothetical protein
MRCSRIFSIFATAVVLALAPTAAPAQGCFSCDEVVQLDDLRAQCFLAGYAELDSKLAASSEGRVKVDFSDCAGGDATRSRGLETLNTPDPKRVLGQTRANRSNGRNAYVLDRAGLDCVKRVLNAKQGPYDPDIVIDVTVDCSQ